MTCILTYNWLRRRGACKDQRDLAALHFGRSAPLTRRTLLECAALGLDLDWLADEIIPAPLWAEYERQRAHIIADILGLPKITTRRQLP